MKFLDYKNNFKFADYSGLIKGASETDVRQVLQKDRISFTDYLRLISPAAGKHLEEMAQKSAALTRMKFGRVINLYAPLYISNECVNSCLYCSFKKDNPIARKTLSLQEIWKEASFLKKQGFSSILVVSSENRKKVPVSFLVKTLSMLKKMFTSVNFEIYPLSAEDYGKLSKNGADGLTVYQETYNERIYSKMHSGPKKNFDYRLETPKRAIAGGFKKISIGSLLGLNDFYEEAFYLGLHLDYLVKKHWQTFFSVSFPRIKQIEGSFNAPVTISDRSMVQIICAIRLFKPETGLNLSTREPIMLRDNLIKLGITSISAGSRTNPGGYSAGKKPAGRQFEVADEREVPEILRMLARKGYQPVFKDWETGLNATQ